MGSMKHAPFLLTFLCLLFHLTTAATYKDWGDIPDCAAYCIKYWTITADGSSCQAEDPKCYCQTSAWYFSMKNCIYDNDTSGCKKSQSTQNKDGILSYIDNIFCPTLNGTSKTLATSSDARVQAASTSDSDESTSTSKFTITTTIHSSSSSTKSSSSSSSTSSSSSPSSSSSSSSSTSSSSTDDSSTTSTSTSTISTSASTSSSSNSSSTTTTSSTSQPSSTSTSSYSVTTTVIIVDPSGNTITQVPTTTGDGGFVQDTTTLKSTPTSSDGAAPGANVLFYDGAMEGILAVSSMMALVMLVGGMVLLVN